jgi:hypothetical protein
MTVHLTPQFSKEYTSIVGSTNLIKDQFGRWINGENSKAFGKTIAYYSPFINGKSSQIMHVHLMPLFGSADYNNWIKSSDPEKRTSNAVLIYIKNKSDYLLLSYWETQAHENVGTKDKPSPQLIALGEIAEHWINTGEILE